MMRPRRPSGALLFSLAAHAVMGALLFNAAVRYDFPSLSLERPPAPVEERVQFVTVSPPGGAIGGTAAGSPPPRATRPSRGLVAPAAVPTTIAPAAEPTGGTPGGVEGGRGAGGGVGVVTGIVPAMPDPRIANDPRVFYPAPKSHAQKVDSAVKAAIYAYSDSVARARGNAGRAPGDWTFGSDGSKWGLDGNKIYLGKFAIPSAVLAALPLRVQANPGESIANRLSGAQRADLVLHAASRQHDDEFKSAVKRIRERKDRERRERLAAAGGQ